ncbi:MAG: two-component system response regulator NarL [Pseudomonadales bacterium]|nr:two-component system response regulator NarL [Pseudomonadales bacterium]
MSEPAQILVIDDHPLLRKGVLQLIDMDDELSAVGEASNGADGVELAKNLDPDLILLDLNMRGMDGIATLKALREEGVVSRIVIYSVSDNDEDVVEAMKAGADGYLLKDMEPEDLLERLKQAAIGKMVVSENLTEILASALRTKPKTDTIDLNNLTGREKQILKLIASGLSNKMIAKKLDIAEGTVKVHVKRVLKKLQLRSRVEAAVWGIQQGL